MTKVTMTERTDRPLRESTGERVRRLRTEKGWSQERLGLEAGVTQQTVGDIEHGREPYAHTLDALATALGTTMDYLYAGRGAP